MKLWTFLFIDADLPYESARVVAADQTGACLTLALATGLDIGALAQGRGRRVLCHYAGEADRDAPAVLRAVKRGNLAA